MITIAVDSLIIYLVVGLVVLAISGSWFWGRHLRCEHGHGLQYHWADPLYGSFGFVAALDVFVCVVIIFIEGLSSLV